MKPPQEPDAIGIGACLNGTDSPVHKLLMRAGQLADVQSAIRSWAGEPLASSLFIANFRDGTLFIYAASAAALTQVRYNQQELIHFLRQNLGLATIKIEVKINPSSAKG